MDSLPFRRAFLEGYLLPHEYRACYGFAASVGLTILMGLLLSREHQGWIGHLVWTGTLVVTFTFIPAAKWFGTYEVGGMKLDEVGSSVGLRVEKLERQEEQHQLMERD